jgi:hypothetical protein
MLPPPPFADAVFADRENTCVLRTKFAVTAESAFSVNEHVREVELLQTVPFPVPLVQFTKLDPGGGAVSAVAFTVSAVPAL